MAKSYSKEDCYNYCYNNKIKIVPLHKLKTDDTS